MKLRMHVDSRGQIVIVVALSLVALIGIVGLAIDSGRGYGVRAKLSSAVDAAAIAAGRALSVGEDDAVRLANAKAAGKRYYLANFPEGYLGAALNRDPSIDAVHVLNDPVDHGYWRITVNGSAEMPVTFLRVLNLLPGVNIQPVTVAANAYATKRDVDVMLVMDTSGSLGPPTSSTDTLYKLQTAANTCFVSKFTSGAGGDRLGVVTFASGAIFPLAAPIDRTVNRGFDRAVVTNAVNTPTSTAHASGASGSTAQAEGMRRATDELNAVPAQWQSSLRAIVLFSDGAPNDVTAQFPLSGGGQVTGDLYSETSGTGSGAATYLYRNDQRDTSMGTYPGSGHPAISGLPLQGLGAVDLSGYNGKRTPLTMNGAIYANTRCNVNKAARNMVENLANTARSQGMVVYTVGLGQSLTTLEPQFSGGNCGYSSNQSTSPETGGHILKRLANASPTVTPSAGDPTLANDTYNAAQPTGLYLYAGNVDEVCAAFNTIAADILRLSGAPKPP